MESRNHAEAPHEGACEKHQKLNVDSDEARKRMEHILREQIDLELFLKQKEINTISSNLRHSEALLEVLETAIRSIQLTNASPEDMADGYLSYLHRAVDPPGYQYSARGLSGALRERPRRTAAMAAASSLSAKYSADLDFGTHDEAVRICGHAIHSDSDKLDNAANSDLAEIDSDIAAGQTTRLHSLATRLDNLQMASVIDALEFINRPLASEAESSDSGNLSDTHDTPAYMQHVTKASTILGAKSSSDIPMAQESRFHVIRRIVLGNSSQYIAPENRPVGKENSTHKWTVYIRSVSENHSTAEYIRKVRVFLHPSYRPDDIVDLLSPDFTLTRWGWGEFPVRLQIFFRDKRNKPVDLIHMLKLDDMWTGNVEQGAEKLIDFELDRRGLNTVSSADEDQHAFAAAQSSDQIMDYIPAAVCAVLQACGTEASVLESFRRLIEKSDIETCSMASEALMPSTLSSASKVLAKLPEGWDKSDDENDVDIMLTSAGDRANHLVLLPNLADGSNGDNTLTNIYNTASLIRAYHLEQQSERDLDDITNSNPEEALRVGHIDSLDGRPIGSDTTSNGDGDERNFGAEDCAVDWIWSAIRPLELSCAPASRFTESSGLLGANDGKGPESLVLLPNCNDETFGEALEQRLVVGRLFVDIARLFLRDIVSASDKAMRRNRAACIRANSTSPKEGGMVDSHRRLLMLTPLHVVFAAKHNPQLFDVCTNAFLGNEE
ncbi:hypothetical protein GGI11_000824 [Coemansia sp. RSA 2049]|nr:hypothetical protein GGI11_000824 [Coemansia sp. RSA 2049]